MPSPLETNNRHRHDNRLPVHPGIPGKQAFWNVFSTMGFMVAPAFDLPEVPGSTRYRFRITPEDGSGSLDFDAKTPWTPLSAVWEDIPVGFAELTVTGMDGNRETGVSGTRKFYRKAGFERRQTTAVCGYRECGILKLRHLFASPEVVYWLDHGSPNPAYEYYCYPSKMITAVLSGLTRASRLFPPLRAQALRMAQNAADFLIRASFPADSVYPYLPPTYRGDSWSARGRNDIVMMVYPPEAAMGYLDLYDETLDGRYWTAAWRIADTLSRTRRENGTWPLQIRPATGEAVTSNDLIPIETVRLFQRLENQYGIQDYQLDRQAALDWIFANPVCTFNWEAQFEDVPPGKPYTNLSKGQACHVARFLLENASDHPEYTDPALEIIRFAEDQFVVWAHPNPELQPDGWPLPCALEQYSWMMPINASASDMIQAWAAAFHRTGEDIYRQKSMALADRMTMSQLPDGELPTYWHHPNDRWLNCSVYSAITMIDLEESGIHAEPA